MKKMLCTLLALVMLLTNMSFSIAEEAFSIRDGVAFGMTITDVKKIEKQAEGKYYDAITKALSELSFQAFMKGMKEFNITYDNEYKFMTKIVGQDCLIDYVFNDRNTLSTIHYLSEYNALTTNITDALVTKYGTPQYTTSKIPFDTAHSYFYNILSAYYNNCNVTTYSGWLIKFSDCYVAIEAECFSISNTIYYESITYTPISFDEYTDMM